MYLTYTPGLIQWHEGMSFLSQHFQKIVLRFKNILLNYYSMLSVYHYGIINIEIDLTQLIKNYFHVKYLHFIVQYGYFIKSDHSNKDKSVYPLPNPKNSQKSNIYLYLCIPKFFEKNYVVGNYPGYKSSEMFQTEDLNTLSNPIHIPKLAPKSYIAKFPIPYNYQNLLKILKKTAEKINFLLDKTVNEYYNLIPFNFELNKYILNICSSKINHKIVYIGTKNAPSELESDTIQWLDNSLIYDNNNYQTLLKNRALSFIRRKSKQHPKVVPRINGIIFEIELENLNSNNSKLRISNYNKTKRNILL